MYKSSEKHIFNRILLYTQLELVNISLNNSRSRISFYHGSIKAIMVLNQQRHPGSRQVKTTLHFLLFEDKGRLQAHGNGIKI